MSGKFTLKCYCVRKTKCRVAGRFYIFVVGERMVKEWQRTKENSVLSYPTYIPMSAIGNIVALRVNECLTGEYPAISVERLSGNTVIRNFRGRR